MIINYISWGKQKRLSLWKVSAGGWNKYREKGRSVFSSSVLLVFCLAFGFVFFCVECCNPCKTPVLLRKDTKKCWWLELLMEVSKTYLEEFSVNCRLRDRWHSVLTESRGVVFTLWFPHKSSSKQKAGRERGDCEHPCWKEEPTRICVYVSGEFKLFEIIVDTFRSH